MTTESWMFEKSWDEFVILYFRDVLLFQGPFPGPHPGVVHLLLLETFTLSHPDGLVLITI